MNIVKIYKGENEIPTFVIESSNVIDTTKYVCLWGCKEEIYINDKLINTIYHTL
jgi:hypothetical protein